MMEELNSILKRSKFENIMAFLLSGIDDREEMLDNFDEIISQSHETFFNELESLCKEANRNDDNLFDIVSTLTNIHDEVYFQLGMIIGFQLYKGFDISYQNHKDTDIPSLLKKQFLKNHGKHNDIELNTMIEEIQSHRIENVLEDTLNNNDHYQKLVERKSQMLSQINEIGLTHKQLYVANSILSACNEQMVCYGELAYKQGFKDGVKLYNELLE